MRVHTQKEYALFRRKKKKKKKNALTKEVSQKVYLAVKYKRLSIGKGIGITPEGKFGLLNDNKLLVRTWRRIRKKK